MLKPNPCVWFVCLMVLITLMMGCQTHKASKNMMGAVEVCDEQMPSNWPKARPNIIYVRDFALDVDNFQADQGVGGVLPGRLRGRLGERITHPITKTNPEQQVAKIVAEMNKSLISNLKDKGFIAQRLEFSGTTALPESGWLLQGVFTEVDEGNRLKRAAIGFGQGATQMDVQVSINDLASANPKEPFIVFGTVTDPKKIPGAIVTMNPYVAAAKFVLEKNATDKDIQKSAEQIVNEILKNFEKLKP
jgi:hypothetical protein